MKKQFKTQGELFKYLVENKKELIDLKKAAIKRSDVVVFTPLAVKEADVVKSRYLYENDEEKGVLKRTIVANTYNWLDSHGDVHLSNVFKESIASGKRVYHLKNHEAEREAQIGKPIKLYEKEISWRELGQGKTGMTQALFLETEIKRSLNETYYNEYLSDDVDQHSVAMQYVKIALAVNDEENYPREYEEWQKHIGKLGNRSVAEQKGYFWAVYEAKVFEVSAVLWGSNELTPTMGKKSQPSEHTEFEVIEPPKSTQNKINYQHLIKNL